MIASLLIRDAPCTVFLIVDNLEVHPTGAVTHWVQEHRDPLELSYLPLNVIRPSGAGTSASRHSSKEKARFRYRTLIFQPDKWPFLLSSIIMFVLILEKLKNLSIP